MDRVLGVMKAYTTRVGEGPFPSEDQGVGDFLHGLGREFGSTTGRARRCGWLDTVGTRYAAMINGIDALAITNLDGLDTFDAIRICIAYRLDGKRIEVPPTDTAAFARCTPIYEELPGWKSPTTGARTWKDLPAAARKYLERVAELTGAPLSIISIGPHREETIIL
jgi:adenylosuccinate synthase